MSAFERFLGNSYFQAVRKAFGARADYAYYEAKQAEYSENQGVVDVTETSPSYTADNQTNETATPRDIHADAPSRPLDDEDRNVRIIELGNRASHQDVEADTTLLTEPEIEPAIDSDDELVVPDYPGPGGYAHYFEEDASENTAHDSVAVLNEQDLSHTFNIDNFVARPFPMKNSDSSEPGIAVTEIRFLAEELMKEGPVTVRDAYREYIFHTDRFMDENIFDFGGRLEAYYAQQGIDPEREFNPDNPNDLMEVMSHVHALAYPAHAHDSDISLYTNTAIGDYFADIESYGSPERPFPVRESLFGQVTAAAEIKEVADSIHFFEHDTLVEAYRHYLSKSPFRGMSKSDNYEARVAEYVQEHGLDIEARFDLEDRGQLVELMAHVHGMAYPQWAGDENAAIIRSQLERAVTPDLIDNPLEELLAPRQ